MKKKIEQELNKIVIPKELHERSRMGIENARSEIKWGNKMNKYLKRIAGVAGCSCTIHWLNRHESYFSKYYSRILQRYY